MGLTKDIIDWEEELENEKILDTVVDELQDNEGIKDRAEIENLAKTLFITENGEIDHTERENDDLIDRITDGLEGAPSTTTTVDLIEQGLKRSGAFG